MPAVQVERIYGREAASGTAVLVDRVWPRGIRRDDLGDVLWMREIGPSEELRRWYGHRPERWPEFRRRYLDELATEPRRELVGRLEDIARRGPLTLLFGARDTERNQAVVIREVLEERLHARASRAGRK